MQVVEMTPVHALGDAMNAASQSSLCLGCDQPLEGDAEARCPACGRSFDPLDSQTVNASGQPLGKWGRWRLRAPAWPILLLALGIAAGSCWVYRTPNVTMVGLNYYYDPCFGGLLFGLLAAARGIQLLGRNASEASLGVRPIALRSRLWFWLWLFVIAGGTYGLLHARLPMRLGFAVSRPALDRIADEALADPNHAHLLAGQWVGVYRINGVEVIGETVVLYLGRDRGSYGFARVPGATKDVIHNRIHEVEGPQRHQAFPQDDGFQATEGRRMGGDWFVFYSWYWLVKVGWS